jgi:hypothetical protein
MLQYDELFLSAFTPLAVHRYEDMLLEYQHKDDYSDSYINNDATTAVKKKKKQKKEKKDKVPPAVDWYPPKGEK